MESSGLRRKDTTRGPPLRILSLDGGGVRGYSMLIIIQELMHLTYVEMHGTAPKRNRIPKPCDHFDLIVGTGTGGLIALMLGRLRLDLETCKKLYARLTRFVFETDKTIAGIPYRSTLFKASKLEEAIKEVVREHTANEKDGNDDAEEDVFGNMATMSTVSRSSAGSSMSPRRNPSNASVVSFSARSPQAQFARPVLSGRGRGDPNARLYDERENRTKTAVTAVYKGSQPGAAPALLRSYDSRAEPPPEYDCTIWEAGRATCAIGLAFKGIQIGQYMFHDDGGGTFNPTPHALDEAVCNEWPGREVGVCVSVGTGKRPKNSEINQALWYEGLLGEFAEARKRLIAKIEGCEKIHEYVKREHLAKRGVNIENYYRFNVEVGVGEYGMNEWNRLADISTSTRQYLSSDSERQAMHSAASKLAKIAFAKQRMDRLPDVPELHRITPTPGVAMDSISSPLAAELPAEIPSSWPPPSAQAPPPLPSRRARTPPSRSSYESGTGPDHLSVPGDGPSTPSPRTSGERLTVVSPGAGGSNHAPNASPGSHSDPGAKRPTPTQAPGSAGSRPPPMPPRTGGAGRSAGGSPRIGSSDGGNGSNSHSNDADRLTVEAPTPEEYRTGVLGGAGRAAPPPPPPPPPPHPPVPGSGPYGYHVEPPPRPPKTPLIDGHEAMSRRPIPQQKHQHQQQVLPPPGALPYPLDDDELPPPVPAVGKKPEFRGR